MVNDLQSEMVQSGVYQKYIRPFQLVEQFKLKCGYEKSFKFSRGQLLRNRYLLGIDKSLLDGDRLQVICEQMNMPASHYQEFLDHKSDANLVLLGFEEGSRDATYRIYLEFWDNIQEVMQHSVPPYPPLTMFLGYKWSAFDNSKANITKYTYYPGIELGEMLRRLGDILDSREGKQMLEITGQILSHSIRRTSSQSLIYLEAGENGNPRKSFDINLYRAGSQLKEIFPQLLELCRLYSVDSNDFEELYRNAGSCALGHISGGLDRKGQSFFTVYYEVD